MGELIIGGKRGAEEEGLEGWELNVGHLEQSVGTGGQAAWKPELIPESEESLAASPPQPYSSPASLCSLVSSLQPGCPGLARPEKGQDSSRAVFAEH